MWKHVTGGQQGFRSHGRATTTSPTSSQLIMAPQRSKKSFSSSDARWLCHIWCVIALPGLWGGTEVTFEAKMITGLLLNYICPFRFKEVKLKSGKYPLYYWGRVHSLANVSVALLFSHTHTHKLRVAAAKNSHKKVTVGVCWYKHGQSCVEGAVCSELPHYCDDWKWDLVLVGAEPTGSGLLVWRSRLPGGCRAQKITSRLWHEGLWKKQLASSSKHDQNAPFYYHRERFKACCPHTTAITLSVF